MESICETNQIVSQTSTVEAQASSSANIPVKSSPSKQCFNFVNKDCVLLCAVLEKYSDVLDMSKNDALLKIAKEQMWQKVAKEYNEATDGEKYTPAKLKTIFNCLKLIGNKNLKAEFDAEDEKIAKGEDNKGTFVAAFKKLVRNLPDLYTIQLTNQPDNIATVVHKYHKKKIDFLNKQIDNCTKEHMKRMNLLQLEEERTKLEISAIREKIARGRMRLRDRRDVRRRRDQIRSRN